MAEVLQPLMSSSSTITMLHSRPSSSDAFQQDPPPQSPRLGQTPRSMYASHTQSPSNSYRGPSSAPIQPYAFQSTPHLRQDSRSNSITSPAQLAPGAQLRSNHAAAASTSSASSDTSSSKDDSLIGSQTGSLINLSSSIPDLSLVNLDQQSAAKSTPDRYRRPQARKVDSINAAPKQTTAIQEQHQTSVDDMAVKSSASEAAKRYRRRSLNNLDTSTLMAQDASQRPASSGPVVGATSTPTSMNPTGPQQHRRTGSREAATLSTRNASSNSVEKVDDRTERTSQTGVTVPPRGSSDANKRMTAPSPLSRQAVEPDNSPKKDAAPVRRTYAAVAQAAANSPSPAAQHLAAVSDKDLNKGMKSRLRRAFSFGSAQELRRASAQNNLSAAANASQTENSHGGIEDELDPEQQEIARRQEAAGIGAGIYSGQGGFTGSTDNISISSTASSASMMLRKMGQSARKSARSIKGLFRPKSVIGVPAADGPVQVQPGAAAVQPSVAQVSMVTVEAERQKVNVNVDPAERLGGGTGYPRLERNSMDAINITPPPTRGSADGTESATSRRSIVGSEKERAEVLAAVKKGILKRSATDSPVLRPIENVPQIVESPASSMPSTPKDRAGSMNGNVSADYFSPRLASLTQTKSMPSTPNGTNRSISFSPRIQFHDAWSSTEYDRRGEIATCNRLTPMLAQQIKEELNNFKMEMEVHELSKPHTHFF